MILDKIKNNTMTQESKQIIFARYIGSRLSNMMVILNNKSYSKTIVTPSTISLLNDEDYLLLTPLSQITDKHLLDVINLCGYSGKIKDVLFEKNEVSFKQKAQYTYLDRVIYFRKISVEAYQHLQQLGYALPQTVIEDGKPVTYSVEELVELNIYKLKN